MENNRNSVLLLLTFCALSLLAAMNSVLFNVALSHISKDLSVNPSQVSWIAVGYSMVVAIGSVTYGKLADYISIKKLLIIGIVLFNFGSIIGFIEHKTYIIVIFARLLQASGGSAFITLVMVSIGKMIEPTKRPGAFALISIAIALALGIGPLVGGTITNFLGWHYLFLLMVISIICIWLLFRFMPNETRNLEPIPFDYIGSLLLFALIATFLLGVNINGMLFILFVVFLISFVFWMKRVKYPFIDIKLLKNTTFLRVIIIGCIINVAQLANMFLLPLLLANKYQQTPFSIGVILFFVSLFSILSSFLTGKFLPKYGNIKIIYIASFVMITGFFILGFLSNTNIYVITLAVILVSIGYSPIQVSLNSLVPLTLHAEEIGLGLGVYNVSNFIGMAFGPALSSKIIVLTNSYGFNFILIAFFVSVNFLLLYKLPFNQQKKT
ncbi:MFS transporter [Bacillus cereus]|uniref:MFS transporter n=1 Tax=Bacillus cereus TaxID=1396 RepID=UPI0008FE3481|nr:MFS transporter [Bacillus cereus]MDN4100359.1 MFS transporter [Bacillus cereus]OJE15868.1 MFS transporter [Bacillus cereus]